MNKSSWWGYKRPISEEQLNRVIHELILGKTPNKKQIKLDYYFLYKDDDLAIKTLSNLPKVNEKTVPKKRRQDKIQKSRKRGN